MHPTLSCRTRLDIATIIIAGAASTVFFLTPVWTSFHSLNSSSMASTASSREDVQLAAVEPAVDLPIVSAPQPRAAIRGSRARRTPEFVRAKADVKPERSRLSLALARSER